MKMCQDCKPLFDIDLRAVDRVTLRVVMPGIHYELPEGTIPDTLIHSSNPIPVFERIPSVVQNCRGFINLTGRKIGRFLVVGLSSSDRRKWVVRCQCGNYEVRTAKALKNINNAFDRCHACHKNIGRARHYEFMKTGKNTKTYAEMMEQSK